MALIEKRSQLSTKQARAGNEHWGAGHLTITIANTGCTLSKQETVHVFDRFWREDSSRGNTGVHSGLGLALAKRITELLGGTIRADVDGSAFRVSVTLPPASDQARA